MSRLEELRLMAKVARMYYDQGIRQQEITERLNRVFSSARGKLTSSASAWLLLPDLSLTWKMRLKPCFSSSNP
jgi:hypothetical protein